MTTPTLPKKLKFSNTWLQCCLCLLAIPGLFAIIVVLVQATFAAQWRSDHGQPFDSIHKLDSSMALAILRTVQAILSTLTTFTVEDSFQFVMWSLISRPKGVSYTSILALTPTTGALGMIRSAYNFIDISTFKQDVDVIEGIVHGHYLAICIDQTSTVTVYDTGTIYNVTAGVGPFNGSYVQPFIESLASLQPDYSYQLLPYTYFASVYNPVISPLLSNIVAPVQCSGSNCFSYLLSGGLEMVTPWNPLGYANYPLVKIDSVPTIQVEFDDLIDDDFADADCDVFGASNTPIGIRLCIAGDDDLARLRAGIFVCTNGTEGGVCHTTVPTPNITTAVTFFQLNTEALSSPIRVDNIDLPAYKLALDWLLNYTAAGISAPSSIVSNFWIAADQLRDPLTYGILLFNFQSILVFPFWLFNANNWGNTALQSQTIIDTLPSEFYTRTSIVAPYTKLRFDSGMFYLFVALQGSAIIFTWGVLLGVWFQPRIFPMLSSFPLFDVAFKAKIEVKGDQKKILTADSSDIIGIMGSNRAALERE
ncbi:hypothetical protein F4820DRAFT_448962 [Hypoxylon rubiginosum]|uniref:Uncharacterized protein n=1 Tax=Hypoxylon rubiginosum TaxID=110542 RepID=A0ACB9Z049_9PEZI|nr:hypothetical protein F4820DRAFT_448962 [Hypoxylon rubiginosum]